MRRIILVRLLLRWLTISLTRSTITIIISSALSGPNHRSGVISCKEFFKILLKSWIVWGLLLSRAWRRVRVIGREEFFKILLEPRIIWNCLALLGGRVGIVGGEEPLEVSLKARIICCSRDSLRLCSLSVSQGVAKYRGSGQWI